MAEKRVRLIAFYLPQFHPISENDEWWGRGFTEWTNVVKAKPLFKGHYQPRLPSELGFYDLRLPEVREAQADLASEYGIYGFCYYHYWFGGRRLLERPFDEVLALGKPSFPFCLCWANEKWTRVWDGSTGECLIEQVYSDEDDRRHMRWLASAFRDPRYIRIDGKPIFLVYRATDIPDAVKTTSLWREEAQRVGVGEIFLCRVESFPAEHTDPIKLGFDAAVEFQPDWTNLEWLLPPISERLVGKLRSLPNPGLFRRLVRKLGLLQNFDHNIRICDYPAVVQRMLGKPIPSYPRFPCVTPGWDNTARRRTRPLIFQDSSPAVYEHWLREAIQRRPLVSPDWDLVFINAWNEWGEGNHLEPCQKWGREFLEATRRAIAP